MGTKTTKRHEVLATFLNDHSDGWHHGDWERLLDTLRQKGLVGLGEEDTVGLELERTSAWLVTWNRLGVPGLGPKRRSAVADAFPRRYDLTHASVEALSRLPSMNRRVAEALVAALD